MGIRVWSLVLSCLLLLLSARSASAQSAAGPIAAFSLPTTSGATRSIAQFRGRVTILFYETRDTISQNQHVKDALGARARQDPALGQRFAIVPVANVAEHNFWPAEYFAREAIGTAARQSRLEFWFDWNRLLIRQLQLRDGVSNVVVLDRQGRVRFHRWGAIPASEVNALMDQVRTLADEQ